MLHVFAYIFLKVPEFDIEKRCQTLYTIQYNTIRYIYVRSKANEMASLS